MSTKKSTRPAKVRILGKDYRVQFVKEATPPLSDEDMGFHDFHKQVITVQEDIHWQAQASTLLHECIHAIDEASGSKLTEEQVLALENGLYALLTENGELFTYLSRKQ